MIKLDSPIYVLANFWGGPSGAVDYPDYQEDIHVNWLTKGTKTTPGAAINTSLQELINTALGASGNPWTPLTAFDPNAAYTYTTGSPLQLVDGRAVKLETAADGVAPTTDWGTYVDTVKAKVDATIWPTSVTNDLVTDWKNATDASWQREVSQYLAGLAQTNSVNSSSFAIGLALLTAERLRQVANFTSQAVLQRELTRQKWIESGTQQVMSLVRLQLSVLEAAVVQRLNTSRTTVAAEVDQQEADNMYTVEEVKWDFWAITQGFNALAALGGGAVPQPSVSRASSTIGGVLSGAALGAEAAAVIPGVGPLLGAGVGALLGGLQGFFA